MSADLDQLRAELAIVREELRSLRAYAGVERSRVLPAPALQYTRLNDVVDGGAGSDPDRYHNGFAQEVDGSGLRDVGAVHGIKRPEHGPWLQPWAQDCVTVRVGHFRYYLPVPMVVSPVRIESVSAGDPTEITGKYASITLAPTGEPSVGTLGDAIPVLNATTHAAFHDLTPFYVGQIIPCVHLFPPTDDEGASTVDDVDPDKGLFLAFVEPPASAAVLTWTPTSPDITLASGEKISATVTVKVDGTGKLTESPSVSLTLTPP